MLSGGPPAFDTTAEFGDLTRRRSLPVADTPKATKMTLEEAVEIVECGRFDYCHPRGPDYDPSDARAAVWDRARAIVDQAVKAHKAECARLDCLATREGRANGVELARIAGVELRKLRALERGESEGKP